jgi:hypothetical protein
MAEMEKKIKQRPSAVELKSRRELKVIWKYTRRKKERKGTKKTYEISKICFLLSKCHYC